MLFTASGGEGTGNREENNGLTLEFTVSVVVVGLAAGARGGGATGLEVNFGESIVYFNSHFVILIILFYNLNEL
jgi:hypothetical protein